VGEAPGRSRYRGDYSGEPLSGQNPARPGGTIIREKALNASLSKSTFIPTSFYMYNDFACNNNNKWLINFIPVR